MTTTQQKPMPARLQLDVSIRWMIRRDMPSVLGIEGASSEHAWTEEDFIQCLRQRNCIGMVADIAAHTSLSESRVVGYMIYELHQHQLKLLNLAVHDECRYKSVGRQMVKKLVTKLTHDRRSRITFVVRESNLDGQLFLRRIGFKAVGISPGHHNGTGEDAYEFEYRYREAR